MADFNDDELDKGFRRVIEGKSIEPPASLWADIRISALERQLIRYQSLTSWFKGTIGVLSALLVGAGYFIYQAPKTATALPKEVSVVTKIDTVYVTRTEKVYVDRPVLVYSKSTRPTSNELSAELNQSDIANDVSETDKNLAKVTEPDSETAKTRLIINGVTKNSKRVENNIDKAEEVLGNLSNRSAGKKWRRNALAKNPIDNAKTTNFLSQKGEVTENETIETKQSAEEDVFSRLESGTIDYLEPLPIQPEPSFGIPKINVHSAAKTAASSPKIKVPFVNRLSVSAYVMPKGNSIDVRRGEPNAFKYGNEELGPGVAAGLRAGIKLTDRWSVLAGIEFEATRFGDGNHRQILTAEPINGTFGYLYRTALGTVEIPDEELSTQAQAGSVVGLEVRESIQRYVLNLPLSMRYDVWGKRFRFLQQVPMKVQFYGLLSGYWQIPLLQEGHVEIFEASGRQLTGELTKFQNLHSSFGINLGIGTELGIGKRFHVFIEPTYTQGITSVVRDMPLRSVTNSFGVKVGTKWNIKRQ